MSEFKEKYYEEENESEVERLNRWLTETENELHELTVDFIASLLKYKYGFEAEWHEGYTIAVYELLEDETEPYLINFNEGELDNINPHNAAHNISKRLWEKLHVLEDKYPSL